MLLEENPKLAKVDLNHSGAAADYRIMDFRKPMLRFCGQDLSESHQVQDFPVFNGKYSSTCYIDETMNALNEMYTKRGLEPSSYLRSLKTVFMHRPYRRMPETGWAIAYLFALGSGNAEDRVELASYCYEAGIELKALLCEMASNPKITELVDTECLNHEAYPLTMAIFRIFRASHKYRSEVLDKLALGSDKMLDLGNLYTAALPAWMAAGFEQALDEDLDLDGNEVLTLGYGSGDAAEVIPVVISKEWKKATESIRFSEAMEFAIDLEFKQYKALHDGRIIKGLDHLPKNEFVIEKIGQVNQRQFQDIGIEYYRYVS
jgi:hydroxymethylglutaryl-CoA synthase